MLGRHLMENAVSDSAESFLSASSPEYENCPTLRELNAQTKVLSWTKVPSCPACGRSNVKMFARLRHIDYDRCADCGFTFANPLPSEASLSTFYNTSFYNNYRKLEAARIAVEPYFSISFGDLPRLASWIENMDRSSSILD